MSKNEKRLVITTNKETALAVQSLFRSGNNTHRSVQLLIVTHEKGYSNMIFLIDQNKPQEQHFADMFFIGNLCNVYKKDSLDRETKPAVYTCACGADTRKSLDCKSKSCKY